MSGVAKNTGRSDFGGDKTLSTLAVSPLTENPAPFLPPDTMQEGTDPLTGMALVNIAEG